MLNVEILEELPLGQEAIITLLFNIFLLDAVRKAKGKLPMIIRQ